MSISISINRSKPGEQISDTQERLEKVEPFNEPICTVKEIAEILGVSENYAINLFAKEPGVRDLAPVKHFGRRRRQLRIPHSVAVRVWNRADVNPNPKNVSQRLQ